MKKSIGLFLLIFLFAALLGCGDGRPTTPPTQSQTVAFLSEVGTSYDYQIQTMKSDGSAVTPVGAADKYGWAFRSSDGKEVTFEYFGGGSEQIGTMKIDGSGRTIFSLPGNSNYPQFTPDGTKIVYTSCPQGQECDLMLVNHDGSNPTNLTANSGYSYGTPTVSPDGKTIAVVRRDGLCILNLDGTGMTIIATGNLWKPTFSADGKTIFFENASDRDIYSVNIDGTHLAQLTTGGYSDYPIVVGNKILFQSTRDSQTHNWADYEIYSINPDGSNVTRLTNNTVYDGFFIT